MSNELRIPKEYEEIDDVSDGVMWRVVGRLIQAGIGLGFAGHALHSYAEKGFSTETVIESIIAVGGPILIEWAIRTDAQDIHETYHEPGVVEE